MLFFGNRGKLSGLIRACANMAQAGLDIAIEATVTTKTYDSLPALEAFCVEHGIRALHLRAVAPHKVRPVDDLLLTDEMLRAVASRAGVRGGVKVSATPAFSPRPSCGEGLDALTFLPNGVVTKCTALFVATPQDALRRLVAPELAGTFCSRRNAVALLKRVVASAHEPRCLAAAAFGPIAMQPIGASARRRSAWSERRTMSTRLIQDWSDRQASSLAQWVELRDRGTGKRSTRKSDRTPLPSTFREPRIRFFAQVIALLQTYDPPPKDRVARGFSLRDPSMFRSDRGR